jgi:hypothetical protein
MRTFGNKWRDILRRETRQVEYVPWRGQLLVTKSLGRIILYVSRWSFSTGGTRHSPVCQIKNGLSKTWERYSPGHQLSLLAFVHAHNKLNPFSDPTKLDWIPRTLAKRNAFLFCFSLTPFCRIARSLFHRFPY